MAARKHRFLVVVAALSVVLAGARAQAEGAAAGGRELRVSRIDLELEPPAQGGEAVRFRFSPDGEWIGFDRVLRLSAAWGEERRYSLEVDPGDGRVIAVDYVIDKRPPAPPRAEPSGGLRHEAIAPALSCEEGARIYWAVFGPGPEAPSFSPLGPDSRPRLEPPVAGTVTRSLVAYAEDRAGNRSRPAVFVYRLAEPGLPALAAEPAAAIAEPLADRGLPRPRLTLAPGSAELEFDLPQGAALLTAVGVDSPPASADGFSTVEADGGLARLRLACPYGWRGRLKLYYGVMAGGRASYSPEALTIDLAYPVDAPKPPSPPREPYLAADESSGAAFVFFPPFDGRIFVSIDGSAPAPYIAPVAVAPGRPSLRVDWFGESADGLRSASRSATLETPTVIPETFVEGVEEGAVLGRAVRIAPRGKAALRYELLSREVSSLAGAADPGGAAREYPPEPDGDSALLGEGITVDCPPGKAMAFALRYRPFAQARGGFKAGEGTILRFVIDREPPSPPRLSAAPPQYADRPLTLAFEPGEPGSSVFVSISADGAESSFTPFAPGLTLPGADGGPVAYEVRAYCADAAGNRSAEMPRASVIIDRSSVYAAQDAADPGDGSPSRPYRSLDAAIAAALSGGKKTLNLRGDFSVSGPLRIAADLAILSGFGPGWNRDRSARASIRLDSAATGTSFFLSGASLTLRGLDLSAPAAGGGPIFELAKAGLRMENCGFSASSAGDILVASAVDSRIALERSTFESSRAMSFSVLRARGSSLELADCLVSARVGVRTFSAVDAAGGSLAIRNTLLESSADLALRLLTLRGSRLEMDRSLIRVDSGSGYLRLGCFEDVSGELRNSRILVSWAGDGLLFECAGSPPAFRHLTVAAETSRGRLGFFSASGEAPEIWNSILSCASGGGALLRSPAELPAGKLVADCLWGFERLVEGPRAVVDVGRLNAINSAQAAFASRLILAEPPSKTFSAPIKSLSPLSRASACVDAAYPLIGEAYALDYKGAPRPSATGLGLPDIGADESGD